MTKIKTTEHATERVQVKKSVKHKLKVRAAKEGITIGRLIEDFLKTKK